MSRIPPEGLLLGTVLVWSFNFTAVRYGITNGIHPLVYVALRWVMAGAALAGIVLLRGQSLKLGRHVESVPWVLRPPGVLGGFDRRPAQQG